MQCTSVQAESCQLLCILGATLLTPAFGNYFVVDKLLPWTSAHSYCSQHEMTLIGDGDDTHNEISMEKKLKSSWTVIKQKSFDYLTWFNKSKARNIKSSNTNGKCGYLDGIGRRIYSDQCNQKHHFVCQFENCVPCRKMHDTCVYESSRCYWLSTISLSWYEARNNCTKGGGDLADRIDEAVVKDLSNILWEQLNREFNYFWLGLRTSDWFLDYPGNVTPVSVYKWGPGGPNEEYDCVALVSVGESYLWKSQPCSKANHVICKENSFPSAKKILVEKEEDETADNVNQTHLYTHSTRTPAAPMGIGTEFHKGPCPPLMFTFGMISLSLGLLLILANIIYFKLRLREEREKEQKPASSAQKTEDSKLLSPVPETETVIAKNDYGCDITAKTQEI